MLYDLFLPAFRWRLRGEETALEAWTAHFARVRYAHKCRPTAIVQVTDESKCFAQSCCYVLMSSNGLLARRAAIVYYSPSDTQHRRSIQQSCILLLLTVYACVA
jgi:hypothetical protein